VSTIGKSDVATLLSALEAAPERAALTFYRGKLAVGRLSTRELHAKVLGLASRLHEEFGVRPGDRVAILAPNRLEIPALVLALLRLGAVVVPLNPGSAPEDWTYILRHSGARGVCATRDLHARLQAEALPPFALAVEDAWTTDAAGSPPAPPAGLEEHAAVILYTSGTTGQPKGVALRQRSLFSNATSMGQNFRLDGTTQLAVLPLYHAHAFGFGLMTALSTGGHLVFTERLEPFTWADVIRAESVSVSSVVPSLLPMLLAAGISREKVPTLRHLMVSSAPLSVELARRFEERSGIELVLGWGLSEYTNFACCMSPFAPAEVRARLMFAGEVPSIGPALDGTEVRVADQSGGRAAEGIRGELLVRGHSTMVGYFGDAEATARAVDGDGWLHTGDEGYFRVEDGREHFFITGRIKEIIIRDAEKYSPLRIEARIIDLVPELSGRLVVLGFPHREHGEEVGAFIETPAIEESLRERLLAAIQAMPVAERPKVLLCGARSIPRTHTGKIQRRKMQSWFEAFLQHRGPIFVGTIGDDAAPST
jgi:long-chain acyl-CoA synthetase